MAGCSQAFTHMVQLLLEERILLTPPTLWPALLAKPTGASTATGIYPAFKAYAFGFGYDSFGDSNADPEPLDADQDSHLHFSRIRPISEYFGI